MKLRKKKRRDREEKNSKRKMTVAFQLWLKRSLTFITLSRRDEIPRFYLSKKNNKRSTCGDRLE